MQTIQDIFSGRFKGVETALIQKLRPNKKNQDDMLNGFSEHWPALYEEPQLLVLAFGESSEKVRDLWGGFITDVQPSVDSKNKNRYRIYVDRFQRIGEHNRMQISDAAFYENGGGGGSRIYVNKKTVSSKNSKRIVPPGEMAQRLMWVRKNHHHFRDPVLQHWERKCAVYNSECNGLLVASHIYPWSQSTPYEKTDVNNGLLLSAPLDKLFDYGLISFSTTGKMLVKEHLSAETRTIFGLSGKKLKIGRMRKVTPAMADYLARHRTFHGFE